MESSTTPGQIKRNGTDRYGNYVSVTDRTLKHIAKRHPDMYGHESAVMDTVEDPDGERFSTERDTCIIYESFGTGPGGSGIRVLVEYDDTLYTSGMISGKVITAYPPDPKYTSKVGPLRILRGT